MPTRWESSQRPLFVRTVFVNGSRHAILSQEDPLCQPGVQGPPSRRQSRPNSSQSYTSHCSGVSAVSRGSGGALGGGKRSREGADVGGRRGRGSISSDLQGCLVKLRLVLATHEVKSKTNSEKISTASQEVKKNKGGGATKQKRRKNNQKSKKKGLEYFEGKKTKEQGQSRTEYEDLKDYYGYENNPNITEDTTYYYIETSSEVSNTSDTCGKDTKEMKEISVSMEIRDVCCCDKGFEPTDKASEISSATASTTKPEGLFFPSKVFPNIAGQDIPWNSISAESYFTRSYFNPLSERVLQWLDLASKRTTTLEKQEKSLEEVSLEDIERIFEGSTFLDENNMARLKEKVKPRRRLQRSKSEVKVKDDVQDAVTVEDDVVTVLSTDVKDYPKYSKALNKAHSIKSEDSIPERTSDVQSNLQESIMSSFNSVVTLKEGDKRGVLTRQPKLQESSDEEEESLKTRKMDYWQKNSVRQRRTAFSNRNNLLNKAIESKGRKEVMKRSKREPENQKPELEKLQVQCKTIQQTAMLSPHLQNKIPWLRDYQSGGRNMWPSEKATSKPQLHIFMPAVLPTLTETHEDSFSECDSFVSEVGL